MTRPFPARLVAWWPRLLPWIGVYYLLLTALAVGVAVATHNWQGTLWYCYLALLCIGIGILRRNGDLILAQLNILLVPLLVWNADFFGSIVMGTPLLHFTDYFWEEPFLSRFVTLQHVYTLPVAFAALATVKARGRYLLWWSMLQMTVVYVVTRAFTTPEFNINCIYGPRLDVTVKMPYGTAWFLGVFAMIFLGDAALKSLGYLWRPSLAAETCESQRVRQE